MEALWSRPLGCAQIADYWALTKPEINFMIAIATFAGFYLGCPTPLHTFPFMLLGDTLLC
jgi:heme O synthase-like polyprenyltransferase